MKQWNQVFSQIQTILRREAKKRLGNQGVEQLHKYFMSGNTNHDLRLQSVRYTFYFQVSKTVKTYSVVLLL